MKPCLRLLAKEIILGGLAALRQALDRRAQFFESRLLLREYLHAGLLRNGPDVRLAEREGAVEERGLCVSTCLFLPADRGVLNEKPPAPDAERNRQSDDGFSVG